MPRSCPDCYRPMTPTTYGDVALDTCGDCGGIWFDEGELKRAMLEDALALAALEDRVAPGIAPLVEPARNRRCPDCERVLDRFRYLYDSPVQLDMCGTCGGTWVEDGELRKMDAWLRGNMTAGLEAGRRWTPEQEKKLAEAVAIHERELGRQRMLCGLFATINRMRRY